MAMVVKIRLGQKRSFPSVFPLEILESNVTSAQGLLAQTVSPGFFQPLDHSEGEKVCASLIICFLGPILRQIIK